MDLQAVQELSLAKMSSRFVPKSPSTVLDKKKGGGGNITVSCSPQDGLSAMKVIAMSHSGCDSTKPVSALVGSQSQGCHQQLFCWGMKEFYNGREEGGGQCSSSISVPCFLSFQRPPVPRVGRSGGAAAPCTSSSAPASPGGCAGMESSTAWAGPTSSSAQPESWCPSLLGTAGRFPHLTLEPGVLP